MTDRWAGPFATVNQAGLAMALGVIATAVLLGVLAARRAPGWWWLRGPTLATGAALGWFLAASGSRAAWLGALLGVAWLVRVGLVPWRWLVFGGLIVATLAVIAPGARERFAPRVWDHPSIQHRLALTAGYLALVRDHPGGLAEPHALAERWYLPASIRGRYAAPLNDALAVAARGGWVALGAAVAGVALLIAIGSDPRWRRQPLIAGALALMLVLLCTGLAQGHLTTVAVDWPRWMAAVVVLLLLASWACALHHAPPPAWPRLLWTAIGGTAVTLACVALAVVIVAARHPVRVTANAAGRVVSARGMEPAQRLLLAVDPAHRRQYEHAPEWALIAVSAGWAVGLVERTDQDVHAWAPWQPQALVALGAAADQANGWDRPALLLDPETLPATTGPCALIRARWAPFTPRAGEVAAWAVAAPGRIVEERRRQALRPDVDGDALRQWLEAW